ncbi:hypothetical protein DRQ33_04820 [bacterium]|nr:MAG: hypothetical protein DRQ33_04820 [bacterium]
MNSYISKIIVGGLILSAILSVTLRILDTVPNYPYIIESIMVMEFNISNNLIILNHLVGLFVYASFVISVTIGIIFIIRKKLVQSLSYLIICSAIIYIVRFILLFRYYFPKFQLFRSILIFFPAILISIGGFIIGSIFISKKAFTRYGLSIMATLLFAMALGLYILGDVNILKNIHLPIWIIGGLYSISSKPQRRD